MRKKKRLFSLALCICLVLSLMPSVQLVADAAAAMDWTIVDDYDVPVKLKDTDGDGYYEIDTVAKLYAFSQGVNSGRTDVNAELTADIVINENVLNSSGTGANSGVEYRAWTPIGSDTNQYTGTFNGAGHTISGLYGSYSQDYIGLFGYVGQGGTVENLGVIDSAVYAGSSQYVGMVAGRNDGTIQNCYTIGFLCGSLAVAGLVGYNTGLLRNSFFSGDTTGGTMIGRIVGWNQGGTIENCYYRSEYSVGTGVSYQNGTMDSKTGHKTPAQFQTGEVAYLLGGDWGQTIGTEAYPVPGGKTVYQTANCKGEPTYSNIANFIVHSIENGQCTSCGATFVAQVTACGLTTGFETLAEAINAVSTATAEDKAVVTLLKDIALGEEYQEITSGVFTIDLNGFKIISGNGYNLGALHINGTAAHVTVQDSGEGGKIIGKYLGIRISYGSLTVLSGYISSDDRYGSYGVLVEDEGTANISGGTIIGDVIAVWAADGGTATISGGIISGGDYGGYVTYGDTINITGGTISGGTQGVYARDGGTANISGGTISGGRYGVWATDGSAANISGGTISGGEYGVIVWNGCIATISGGSISGNDNDIYIYNPRDDSNSIITLPLGEDGEGAIFPGGIAVAGMTLNEILGEGAAYWQGDTMVVPADDATRITGGDVTIKANRKHEGEKTYTNNGENHTYVCSGCNSTVIEAHSYYENGLCICGAIISNAVATVSKNGVITGAYATLNNALEEVKDCTAEDQVVLTILKKIELGDSYQEITSGVFTIDLNGFGISNTSYYVSVLCIEGGNVTVTDSGTTGKITGNCYKAIEIKNGTVTISGGTVGGVYANDNSSVTISGGTVDSVYAYDNSSVTISGGTVDGVYAYDNSFVTISGGTITGGNYGVYAKNSTVTISGGSICGRSYGVSDDNGTVNVSGGTITGGNYGVYASFSTVTISGGSISGGSYDIYGYDSNIAMTLGKNGIGATFPGGLKVFGTTLNEILGEDVAYWQGDKMILPADGATEISGDDVTIKAECKHTNGWIDATCTAPKTCTTCGATEGEALGHKDEDNSGRCDVCKELMQPAKLCMASISLKGNIAINYYMLLSDEVLADETAYMQFTMADGEIIKIPVSQGVPTVRNGETYHVFTCAVDAKEMTDDVISQFFYEGGSTKAYSYNVQTYAKYLLANHNNAAIKNLMKAMLNYGAASQLYFGYNTDKLANAGLEAPDYSGVAIEGFTVAAGQGTELAKFTSASLILKSETTLRLFFNGAITAAYNGQELEVKQRNGLYYVDVVGISAKDLDENVTVTIHDGTNSAKVSFNPMTYCQGVLNNTAGTYNQEMKDLVAALYQYNQAANVYFKES